MWSKLAKYGTADIHPLYVFSRGKTRLGVLGGVL